MNDELQTILSLVNRGALFVVNHSGGKDSQAMFHYVRQFVPDSQIVVVHADLPEADWAGTWDHVQATTLGLPCYVTRAGKTFLGMVADRHAKITAAGGDASPWPSPKYRQCTSDLKRGPLEKLIRQISKERGNKLIVSCEGMRAHESSARSKLSTFKFDEGNSKAGREWYSWLPIHHLSVDEVFEIIARVGQQAHWAYARGMTRLSCMFCIMANEEDLRTSALLNPTTYAAYVAMERRTGKTMMMSRKTLEEVTGVVAELKVAA